MNILDRAYIFAKVKAERIKEDAREFMASQSGVANVVATILILLIVIILIGVFWKQLSKFVGDLLKRIFGEGSVPSAEDIPQ